MKRTIIKNAKIINEQKIFESDILIEGSFITKISESINSTRTLPASYVILKKDEANKKAGDNSLLSPAQFLWSFFYLTTTVQKIYPSQILLDRRRF